MQAFIKTILFSVLCLEPQASRVSSRSRVLYSLVRHISALHSTNSHTHTHRGESKCQETNRLASTYGLQCSQWMHTPKDQPTCAVPLVFVATRSVNLLRQILQYAAVSIKIFQPHSDTTVLVCEHNVTSRYGETASQLSLSVEWLHQASIDVHHARWPCAFLSRAEAVAHHTVPHLSEHGNFCSVRWVHQPVILCTPEGLRPGL